LTSFQSQTAMALECPPWPTGARAELEDDIENYPNLAPRRTIC
jgi:hypothetical protein